MSSEPFCVAIGETESDAPLQCIESAVPIALWQTVFKVYEEHDRKQCDDPHTADADGAAASGDARKRNFAIGHEPIAGAFVVCVRVSDATAAQSEAPDARAIAYGRTNEVGWIMRRARDDVGEDGEVPAAPWEPGSVPPHWKLRTAPTPVFKLKSAHAEPGVFYAHAGTRWRIFWTHTRALFERFCGELEADTAQTLLDWEVPEYTIMPAEPPRALPELRLLPVDGLRARYVDSFLLRGNERRYLDAFQKIQRAKTASAGRAPTRTAAILNATPRTFWALYLAEWTQWYTERLIQDDPHWPYLWRLLAAISAAETGALFPDLEKALPAGGVMAESARAMQVYLYACAKRGHRSRRDITTAVHVTTSHDAWRHTARDIYRATGAVHPALGERNLDKYNFTQRQRDALIAYFDLYVLGLENAQDAEPLQAHWEHVQTALGWVRDTQARLIQGITEAQWMRDIDVHLPRQAHAARIALVQRFHYQCACLGVRFWESEDPHLESEGTWSKLAPFLSWLGESTDLLAKVFEKLLDEYITAYRAGPRSVELLINHLYRYHLSLRAGASERTLPRQRATVRLDYDPHTGRVVAQFWRGAKKELLGEYELLTAVAAPGVPDPAATPRTRAQVKRLRRALARDRLRTFELAQHELEVPHADAVDGFAKRLAVAGALLRAGVAITSILEQWKENPPGGIPADAYLAIAEETLQGLEPGVSLAQYMLRKPGAAAAELAAHPFVRGAGALVQVGNLIEAGRNLEAGGQTLATMLAPHQSTSNLALYLSRGEDVPVWLESVKGLVQVATGVTGVMGVAAIGMSTTLAASLGTWVVIGSVLIATLDLAIYQASGGESPVDDFIEHVRTARREQFKLRADGSIKAPDEAARPTPPGARPVAHPTPTSRLSQHLGALHALLREHMDGTPARGRRS